MSPSSFDKSDLDSSAFTTANLQKARNWALARFGCVGVIHRGNIYIFGGSALPPIRQLGKPVATEPVAGCFMLSPSQGLDGQPTYDRLSVSLVPTTHSAAFGAGVLVEEYVYCVGKPCLDICSFVLLGPALCI